MPSKQVEDVYNAMTPEERASWGQPGGGFRHYRNPGEAIGDINRAEVRRWFREHLCGTQRECAEALGLSAMAVNRHVNAIRAEWRDGSR